MSKKKRFINRELSWLEFNQRVLDEACDETIPLLERLKFLAITGSNLDEFLRVRVGGLQGLLAQHSTKADPSGMTPERQLKAVIQRAHQMMKDQYECLLDHLDPALVGHGFRRVATDELTVRQTANLKQIFDSEIFAVLTPMSVSGVSDFPLLVNQTLNVCVRLGPDANSKSAEGDGERYAVIPFGQSTNRFLTLPSEGGYSYTLFEDVVAFFIGLFFPGEPVLGRQVHQLAVQGFRFRVLLSGPAHDRQGLGVGVGPLLHEAPALHHGLVQGCGGLQAPKGATGL